MPEFTEEMFRAQIGVDTAFTIADGVQRLCDENATLRQQLIWQPIETIPIDTDVLLYCQDLRPAIDGDNDSPVICNGRKDEGCEVSTWLEIVYETPTHWMPLPAPPRDES